MAARANGITVPKRDTVPLVAWTVSGTGPTGATVSFTVQANGEGDAIAEGKKKARLNNMTAKEKA